jgi:K+-transporting ATPase ATPase C chain
MRPALRQLAPAVVAMVVFTLVLGVAYPLVVTAVSQVGFGAKADGSLVVRDGVVVGSRLLGQQFSGPGYFHPRPSAAGDGYDAMASSGSNLGPTNAELFTAVAERVEAYRVENGLGPDVAVPVDAVTSSGSGLDPHISVANARLQAGRVAEARGVPLDSVLALVDESTDGRDLGVLNDPGVNVLVLNVALDEAS